MFKNLLKNKFAINKIKDPTFPFKKSLFFPIITTSDKIIHIFKSLRASVLLCQAKKVRLNIWQSHGATFDYTSLEFYSVKRKKFV